MELIEGAKAEVDLHPGCVKRLLTFRDRLLIFQALNAQLTQGGDAKTLGRLVKLQELLDLDGVEDYFDVLNKAEAKRLQSYASALQAHISDPTRNTDPGQKPGLTNSEELGPEATFWIPTKLDSHISAAIKEAKFAAANAKHVLALLGKYQITVED